MPANSVYQNAENAWTLGETYAVTAAEDARHRRRGTTRFRTSDRHHRAADTTTPAARRGASTPADLFGAHRVRREYSEAWAKVFADNGIVAACGRRRCRHRRSATTTSPAASAASSPADPTLPAGRAPNVPVGRDADTGIPVGIDMAAPFGGDAVILQIAIDYQARFPYHLDIPTEL